MESFISSGCSLQLNQSTVGMAVKKKEKIKEYTKKG